MVAAAVFLSPASLYNLILVVWGSLRIQDYAEITGENREYSLVSCHPVAHSIHHTPFGLDNAAFTGIDWRGTRYLLHALKEQEPLLTFFR